MCHRARGLRGVGNKVGEPWRRARVFVEFGFELTGARDGVDGFHLVERHGGEIREKLTGANDASRHVVRDITAVRALTLCGGVIVGVDVRRGALGALFAKVFQFFSLRYADNQK